ncbi:hypothetical protein [Nocardioides plantarum]|uniref:Uncharacterized protein n=1 Tax=Nocardioides plantarum TaxID=29299 RepID=A0ABV5K8H0_9ACTN|nr:hypothetical protein [Nocardioides plantarum]
MDGYGVEVDGLGCATAYGNGWHRDLGRIENDHILGWQAVDLHGRQLLKVRVNLRDDAVRALVRAAGLQNGYTTRWAR